VFSQVKIEGVIPGDWLPTMSEIADQVVSHPWGGGPTGLMLQRLVVADAPYAAMLPLLPEAEASALQRALEANREMVMGRAFRAIDGQWTVVLRAFETEPEFLLFFAHELFECQLDATQEAKGYDHSRQYLTHALWSEYVIERARKEIAISLQLPESEDYERKRAPVALERFFDFVVAEVEAMPKLGTSADEVRMRGAQAWEHFLREWSGDAGRAAAGSPLAQESQNEFNSFNFLENWQEIWAALAATYANIYERPFRQTVDQDNFCLPEIDDAYREPLIELFNRAVQLAGAS
jgi:hypothetical protein